MRSARTILENPLCSSAADGTIRARIRSPGAHFTPDRKRTHPSTLWHTHIGSELSTTVARP